MRDLTAAELGARVLAVTDAHAAAMGDRAGDCVCLGCLSRRAVLNSGVVDRDS